jgi:PAS domain S-box-containing protein
VSGRTIKRAALIFLPLAAAAVVASYLLYASQANAIRSTAMATEVRTVDLARQRIFLTVGSVTADVSYLSEQDAVRTYLAGNDPPSLRHLEAEYVAFARHRQFFGQLRFIDASGREVVRVDRTDGAIAPAPPDQLQDRAGEAYTIETLKLDRGQTYLSDLEFEQGATGQPMKPILRVGAPVFDGAGAKRGIIVIDYLGQRILDRVSELRDAVADIWLVDAQGDWLLGPKDAGTFAAAYPDVWRQMQSVPTGTLENDLGRFSYARTDGEPAGASGQPQPSWFVLVPTPRAFSDALTSALKFNFAVATGGLLALLGGISLGMARYQIHRRESEQLIRLSEARFRAVTETASDAIISADRDGIIRYFNPGAEAIFGHAERDVIGQPLTLLMPERSRQAHLTGLQRYLDIREARVVGRTVELVGLRNDGREFPIELALASSDVDGALFFTAIVRDITVRAEADRRLRASEARFRDLLESAPDAVLITDENGGIQLANAEAERLFGYRRDKLVGQGIEMLIPERYRGAHVGHREGYVRAARTRPMGAGLELYGLRKDGSEFPVAISLSPTRTDDGKAVFCSVRDITEQRAADLKIQDLNRRLQLDNAELEAVNKELEAFSYSVSHDLRAPLRAIDGFSQALAEDAGPLLKPEHHSHLNRVRQAAQRMGLLIDDLIKLARVTRTDVKIDDVDLSEIALAFATNLQDAAPERQAEFTIAPGLHAKGDPRLVQVALDNLLSNSWKFTAPRTPARIEFGKTAVDGKPAFFVRDNGVGFDMAYAGKMFGAFQRFHDAREFAGTGIGLATVQRIIHKHGGRIWAESQPGEGAIFYFTL